MAKKKDEITHATLDNGIIPGEQKGTTATAIFELIDIVKHVATQSVHPVNNPGEWLISINRQLDDIKNSL